MWGDDYLPAPVDPSCDSLPMSRAAAWIALGLIVLPWALIAAIVAWWLA